MLKDAAGMRKTSPSLMVRAVVSGAQANRLPEVDASKMPAQPIDPQLLDGRCIGECRGRARAGDRSSHYPCVATARHLSAATRVTGCCREKANIPGCGSRGRAGRK